MRKAVSILLSTLIICMVTGCSRPPTDVEKQQRVAYTLEQSQPTPTDIEYSLERYNLTRRAYWVNGQREKARTLPCAIQKPLGYIVLMLDGVGIIGKYAVDGKVSSLNSFLTPDSEAYTAQHRLSWLADVDGSYGENDKGIFFFTPDGKYVEWTGTYMYTDIPVIVENPILKVEAK